MTDHAIRNPKNVRSRIIELVLIVITFTLLILISRLETRLFELAEALSNSKDFFSSILYFSTININVILILILSFLVFRHISKLIIEHQINAFGQKLKVRLVISFVLFALAPTVLLFYITASFINTSFDSWFAERVRQTIEQTRQLGGLVYQQSQKKLETLALIARDRMQDKLIYQENGTIIWDQGIGVLAKIKKEYDLYSLTVFDVSGKPLMQENVPASEKDTADNFSAIDHFYQKRERATFSMVSSHKNSDVVKGFAAVYDPSGSTLIGIVVIKEQFEARILGSLEEILTEFSGLRPSAELIKISFTIMMIVVCLLIVFAAIWLGFYVARDITTPLQTLAEATKKVALGDYDVQLVATKNDETGQLIYSFNQMVDDLKSHREQVRHVQEELQLNNEELLRGRRYLEIVFKNITAGVIALDRNNLVITINDAACKLLGLDITSVLKQEISQALPKKLNECFWEPISQDLLAKEAFQGEIDLLSLGLEVVLLVNAVRIFDESGTFVGSVLVFEDAREKMKAQRAAAWREVARRIAHEIKNPLTPIKLSTERILRRFHDRFTGDDLDVFTSCIDNILKQVDSLRNLVNEFSKFSRLPSINTKVEDINLLLRDAVNLYKLSYPHINFDTEGLSVVPLIPIDKEQLMRAMVNIISNAISALETVPEPHQIRVSSQILVDLNLVHLEISDTGSGIPAHLKDRVLEPYFSTKNEGTGLGLAIVNQIISDHGGYLRIADNTPRGTIIIIELPLGAKNGVG